MAGRTNARGARPGTGGGRARRGEDGNGGRKPPRGPRPGRGPSPSGGSSISASRASHVLSIEERERVIQDLRRMPRFKRLGARLLADFVDRCPVYGDGHGLVPSVVEIYNRGFAEGPDRLNAPILAISVIEGAAQARSRRAIRPRGEAAGAAAGAAITLPVGTYDRYSAGLEALALGNLRLDPLAVGDQPVKFLVVTPLAVLTALDIIRSLFEAETDPAFKAFYLQLARPQLVLCDCEEQYRSVLRAVMHAMATAAARIRPSAALIEFGQPIEAATWDPKKSEFTPQQLTKSAASDPRDLVASLGRSSVFVIRPADAPNRARADALTYDRIVYLTDRVPRVLPDHLRKRLPDDAFDAKWDPNHQEPELGAFVPTVLVPPHNPPAPASGLPFAAMEVAHSKIATGKDEPPRGLRPYRDSCVLPLHRGLLRKAWDTWLPQWEAGKGGQFLDSAVAGKALKQSTAERWARAFHWQRVGVALSGGGACAYRFVPVLEQLRRRDVPVDVFAGLSGGALLGVFYCLRGREGLREYVNLGPLIQALMPLASWSTDPFEYTTDYLAGAGRIENLEVRLAAVTVALPDDGPPYGAVVTQGSVGEAARVSGTLPPTYAATEKNGVRYADGGACTAVPARVARDAGADVILACNAIPGPDSCNPFPAGTFGHTLRRVLRRLPPWDRVIDFQTWHSFQWQQTSRAFGDEAAAYLEFEPSEISLAEPALFLYARAIVAAANRQRSKIDKAVDALRTAWIEKW